jgi:hypothetical protein
MRVNNNGMHSLLLTLGIVGWSLWAIGAFAAVAPLKLKCVDEGIHQYLEKNFPGD